MVPLEVRIGNQSSQADVYLTCAMNYRKLASATIGPAGGTVSGGGFSVSLPAGALATAVPLTVYEVAGGAPWGGGDNEPAYGLEGLPEDFDGRITVSMDAGGGAETTFLVMAEDGGAGADTVLEAGVSGGRATATLNAAGVAGESAAAKAPGGIRLATEAGTRAAAFDTAHHGTQLWILTKQILNLASSSGHFKIFGKKGIYSLADLGNEFPQVNDEADYQDAVATLDKLSGQMTQMMTLIVAILMLAAADLFQWQHWLLTVLIGAGIIASAVLAALSAIDYIKQ